MARSGGTALGRDITPSTRKEYNVRQITGAILVAIVSVGLLGCQEKKRDIATDMYPEEQTRLKNIVTDIFIAAKNKDLERLDSFHLHSPKFTKFEDEGTYTRRNIEEARKTENEGFSAVSDFSYEVQDFKADVFGDVAVTTFHWQYAAKMGETPIAGRLRGTLVFVKVENDWKIVHEHFSPFPSKPA
jgi:ketosteroid isomerase-like protein